MIRIRQKGGFTNLESFLMKTNKNYRSILESYGEKGVRALAEATPVDSGITASSWSYRIVSRKGSMGIQWYNTNVVNGVNIAIILQYGHGTRNGGYVQGRDYINPATRPIFDDLARAMWLEVTQT